MSHTDDLLRRAMAVNQSMFALGNETFGADGGAFVRNRARPLLRDANHVAHVTARTPDEIGRLLARVEQEFAGFPHRRFDLDPDTPPEFEAHLASHDYEASEMLYQLLEGEPRGAVKPHDIRLIDSDAGWRDYQALNRIDWGTFHDQLAERGEAWTAEDMFQSRRMKSPPARFWLAYVDGRPVSYLASWQGTEGVGLVDDLFTHPDYRHRGLAMALLHRCVADCREHGAGPVVIVSDPHGTAKDMYIAIGFRPVAIKRIYAKRA